MAESSRRFKSTAKITMKLLQAKEQWPGGAQVGNRVAARLDRWRPMGWQPGGTTGTMVLVDPRDSHVYQPSSKKSLPHINVRSRPRNLLFPSQSTKQHLFLCKHLSRFLTSSSIIHHIQTSNTRALIVNHHSTLNLITNQPHFQDAHFRLLRRPSRGHGCCSELGR